MELIQATERDLQELYSLYRRTAAEMKNSGLNQWNWGLYPTEEMIRNDVERGEMYICRMEGVVAAAIVLTEQADPEYSGVPWTGGIRPGYLHLLAIDPPQQGAGLGGDLLDDALQILRRSGCDCVRCDTNRENRRARRLYEKMGFRICGNVSWGDTPGEVYYAFDKPLKRETPMWPIRMLPAFRSGEETPWGGDRLQKRFGKETGGKLTGESLEVSCMPGYESTDSMGRKLPDLIQEFGEKLVGKYSDKPFPLLLKLIDARDRLSVQVHPDDEYAASNEHGKTGKTEAWLILDAPEGSEIVYGLRPDTSLRQLREACENGKALENLLRRVRVTPGDVCYIPAGCVHSIGPGIMLYEIQQSSDITYRFYDWGRKDEQGNSRELHPEQGLAVADLKCAPHPMHVSEAYGVRRLLTEDSFTLDVIRCGGAEFLPEPGEFGILTVLQGKLTLRWESGELPLREGETCFLPRNAPKMHLRGEGYAALSMPNG